MQGLNPGQKQAVESSKPAILIQAGPGTGKTRTLTARIAYLISEKKTDPNSILALTFTNKAARQLAQRIDDFLPGGNSRVMAATFHGFCLKFLKENLGFNAGVMDDALRLELIKNGLDEAVQPDLPTDMPIKNGPGEKKTGEEKSSDMKRGSGFSGKKGVGQLDRLISLCKQQLLGPFDDLSCLAGGQDVRVLSQVYAVYQKQCRELNLVDFEELIFLSWRHLKASPMLLTRVQNRFAHIFIDEYQDLNLGQYELVKLLAQKSCLLVIGDPDQSIYSFRGSDNKYFKRFTKDYPECEQIFLDQNYRSTQTILDASFQMISTSHENSGSPKIFFNLNTVQKLMIKETATEKAEAVGKMIEKLVGGLSFFSFDARNTRAGESMGEKEYSFSDFAVLFRTKKQGDIFAEVFQKAGIPFQMADKMNLCAIKGISQVLSLFRILTSRANTMDYQSIRDHCDPRVKKKDAKVIVDQGEPMGQIFDPVLGPVFDLISGRDSLACLEILIESLDVGGIIRQNDAPARAYEKLMALARLYPDPCEFMDYLVLDQDQDHLAGSVEKVSLMTLHSAKGLEYPVVFVTGCEQGLIPFARDGNRCDNPEEERRLFYVAMTRAMDILCLTYAKKRRIYGTSQKRQRSFFIDDIEKKIDPMRKKYPPGQGNEKGNPIGIICRGYLRKQITLETGKENNLGKKKMNNSIFKTLELENNHILEIRDESRKIGEDAYVVIMGARMEIQVQKTLFAAQEVSDTQFADIRETLGDNLLYEYKSERNMIMAKDKDQVFDALVDTFLKNMVPYISKSIFPEKKVLKEYRERIEKKNLYR